MVGMPTKRTFCGSQGKVRDLDEDKDKEEIIRPSPVSHSPMHLHLQTAVKITFVNPCFCSPIKQSH